MTSYLKKTILLFTLTGVVFFGGGVGVVRGENNNLPIPNQQPSTPTKNDTGNNEQERIERMARANQDTSALNAIKCGGFWDKLSLGCIMPVITYDLYVVISGVLTLSGDLFDFMLTMSIEKDFINQPFVISLWKVLRDFSNMLFIFILLYAGIRTMLLGDDWKKPVMMVVVIALLINFSLFFTQIIIDAGNTLAVGVYSSMGVTKETSVSAAFVNNFAPQQFFSLSAEKIDLAPTIFIIAGIVGGFFAWVLFKASFLFLGRIISFWALMILSPFAFILLAFPALGAKVKFSFGAWLDILINQAFVAPAFLFFLYIIMKVVQSKPLADFGIPSGSGALMDVLFKPALFAIMIVYALKKALAVADSMSGEFGKIGANLGNKVLGIGLGMASGGATMAIGGGANKILQSDRLQKMAAGEGTGTWLDKYGGKGIAGRFIGRQGALLADETRNMTFDPRNIKFGGIGKGLGAGTGNKEGFMQKEAKWMKEQQKTAKLMEMTDVEKDRQKSGQREIREQIKERGEHKKVVEEVHKDAETKAKNSATGKRVTEAENKKSAAITMAGDVAVKKLEAKKKREAAITDKQKAEAEEEVRAIEQAEQKIVIAEKELAEAQKIHSSSNEYKALENAKENLDTITREIESDKRYLEHLDKAVERTNLRRREIYGKAATLTHPSSWWNRSKKIDKIREGLSPEEKAEEDMTRWWKKMSEKEKKERGESPAAKEKSEKPKEEAPPKTE